MLETSSQQIPSLTVLTGDIVGSTKLDANRRMMLYKSFPILSELLMKKYPAEISYKISNFRGDGWQAIVNNPRKALEISIFIRTFIRFTFRSEKLDTRIAMGVGPVQFIPEDNISAGDGLAYLISGHLLESFTNTKMGIEFSQPKDELIAEAIKNLVNLVDQIITPWGPGQSQAVFLSMYGYTQMKIAELWKPNPVSQASISKSLKSSGWETVKNSLSVFEKLMNAII